MADPHPTEELLLDLALADVDDLQRDLLTAHLGRCEPCRTRYGQLADSVDHLLAAAPRVEPPPGFTTSVLAAIGLADGSAPLSAPGPSQAANVVEAPTLAEGTGTGAGPDELASRRASSRAGRQGRRGLLLAAIAAAVAFLLGAGGMTMVLRAQEGPAQEVQAAGPVLVTATGQEVGTVLDSHYEGDPVLIVAITDGKVGKTYECQLVLADGSRESAGTWTLHEASGATWVIDQPASPVTSVELVTPTGHIWATAQL